MIPSRALQRLTRPSRIPRGLLEIGKVGSWVLTSSSVFPAWVNDMARPDHSFLAPALSISEPISTSINSPLRSSITHSESSPILAVNRGSSLNPSGPSDHLQQPDRKRRHSPSFSTKRDSLRRPRPPPLSSKSSSLIPTVFVESAPADSWSTRSLTMSSPPTSTHSQHSTAADLLRQAMMQR